MAASQVSKLSNFDKGPLLTGLSFEVHNCKLHHGYFVLPSRFKQNVCKNGLTKKISP